MATGQETDFKTDDMCLVASLKNEGFTPQRLEWEGDRDGTCYWFFMRMGSLAEAIEAYMTRTLRVEPRQFNHLFGETKKEFYKLYDEAKG